MSTNACLDLCHSQRIKLGQVSGEGRGSTCERGSILPLAAIAMAALLAMSGLALDMGYLYLNQTRLQNVVDAAALSAAKSLEDAGSKDAAAQELAANAALTAFTNNANLPGNEALETVAADAVVVEFSATLQGGFATAPVADPLFVRVTVANGSFSWPSWLTGLVNIPTLGASASAVAGPSVICPGQIVPMMACANSQTNTTPNEFFGYPVSQDAATGLNMSLDTKVPVGQQVSAGNFQLMDLGGGSIRQYFNSGKANDCNSNTYQVDTAPGNKVGQVSQGVADLIASDRLSTATPLAFSDYAQLMRDNPGVPTARIMAVPFVWCPDLSGGVNRNVTVLGYGCLFLNDQATHKGSTQTVSAELLYACSGQTGVPGGGTGPGMHTVILYKTFGVAGS